MEYYSTLVNSKVVPIKMLEGKIITEINKSSDNEALYFVCSNEKCYMLGHRQDYCEQVYIEDICGDLKDLIGSPILMAEEVSSTDNETLKPPYLCDSYTWTFYKLATQKGSVTIRWFGSSNGYYSESVHLYQINDMD
jgi:hypothetical protein